MGYQHILFDLANGIARLTLNRPDKLNSFNVAMHEEVRDAIERTRGNGTSRVLVITGAAADSARGRTWAIAL